MVSDTLQEVTSPSDFFAGKSQATAVTEQLDLTQMQVATAEADFSSG